MNNGQFSLKTTRIKVLRSDICRVLKEKIHSSIPCGKYSSKNKKKNKDFFR